MWSQVLLPNHYKTLTDSFRFFPSILLKAKLLLLLHNKTCMIHVNGKYRENVYLVMCTGR